MSDARALTILRALLVAHPFAYLATAAGISGVPHGEKIGAASYGVIFVTQLGAVLLGCPDRIARGPRRLLVLALGVPVVTIVPAFAWAWSAPLFDLGGMVRYHGLINVGHVGAGMAALALGRPRPHVPVLPSRGTPRRR